MDSELGETLGPALSKQCVKTLKGNLVSEDTDMIAAILDVLKEVSRVERLLILPPAYYKFPF